MKVRNLLVPHLETGANSAGSVKERIVVHKADSVKVWDCLPPEENEVVIEGCHRWTQMAIVVDADGQVTGTVVSPGFGCYCSRDPDPTRFGVSPEPWETILVLDWDWQNRVAHVHVKG